MLQVYGFTQHAGMGENVLDHRLNTRTVKMCRVNRFLYWNMNYHVEHHMFPMVPYYRLPELHEEIKHDCAPVYPSLWAAYKGLFAGWDGAIWPGGAPAGRIYVILAS
jgi:fatty acid desaturase